MSPQHIDPLWIILELVRMQQLKATFVHNFRTPIRPDTYACPQCGDKTYNALEFCIPEFAPESFEVLARTDPETSIRVSTRVIEGHCTKCGNAWWSTMCAIDPDAGRNPLLGKILPRMRYAQPCGKCHELSFIGFYRMGTCTAGMCTFCRSFTAPKNVVDEFIARRKSCSSLIRNKENILTGLTQTIIHPTIRFTDEPIFESSDFDFTLWND